MTDTALPALAPISAVDFPNVPDNPSLGVPPKLAWVSLRACCVDEGYQRQITSEGARNVRRIIAAFDWRFFTPLIVARGQGCAPSGVTPQQDGAWFLIIDGRHRATAALALSCDRAPAMIVDADRALQARAFRSINLTVTRVSPLYAHRAAIAAGDPDALALTDACARGGVTIAPYPKASYNIAAGETLAIGTLQRMLARYGAETLITALQCVTETVNNAPGALAARTIQALCLVLHPCPQWRDAGEALLAAFDRIDIVGIDGASRSAQDMAAILELELRSLMSERAA